MWDIWAKLAGGATRPINDASPVLHPSKAPSAQWLPFFFPPPVFHRRFAFFSLGAE